MEIGSQYINYAPVVIFAYNRPQLLKEVIASIERNPECKQTNLYIFCDGPRSPKDKDAINEVHEICTEISSFKSVNIFKRNENYGLYENIVQGIDYVLSMYDSVIVLEDDIVVSDSFLLYMNRMLKKYKYNDSVYQISAYGYIGRLACMDADIYALPGGDCLAWGTWKKKWALREKNPHLLYMNLITRGLGEAFNYGGAYDFTGRLLRQIFKKSKKTWAIRWSAYVFLKGGITIYPIYSLARHIGAGELASNYKARKNDPLDVPIKENWVPKELPEIIRVNPCVVSAFRLVLKSF